MHSYASVLRHERQQLGAWWDENFSCFFSPSFGLGSPSTWRACLLASLPPFFTRGDASEFLSHGRLLHFARLPPGKKRVFLQHEQTTKTETVPPSTRTGQEHRHHYASQQVHA